MLRSALLLRWTLALACGLTGTVGCGSGSGEPARTDASTTDAGAVEAGTMEDAATCAPATPDGQDEVRTRSGVVRGTEDDGVHAFLGIPYAAPPVGPLRLRSPEREACWDGVLEATALGPACPQMDGDRMVGEEDCLTVNVWTPRPEDGAELPVLVFLHGGFNLRGSSGYELGGVHAYDGRALAASGPAVVVTLNYRVGALGFLAHPVLAEDGSPAGNYALRDQLAALEWVRENITAFGGDPSRVLLFGQSAGSIDTCALLASPRSAGLMSSAIMLSGACATLDASAAEEMADHLIANVRCTLAADAAACLRDLPVEELVAATFGPSSSNDGAHPTVDGELLPDRPDEVFARGEHQDVPVVVSTTAEEMTILATGLMRSPLRSELAYRAAVEMLFDESSDTLALLRRVDLIRAPGPLYSAILEAYPYADYGSGNEALIALLSDVSYVCPARRTLRALSTGGTAPVRRAVFTGAISDGTLAPFGPSHGIDVLFGFRSLDAFGHVPTEEELALADAVAASWVGMAAEGDPRRGPIDAWPEYPRHLELGMPLAGGEGFREEPCDFWDSLR